MCICFVHVFVFVICVCLCMSVCLSVCRSAATALAHPAVTQPHVTLCEQLRGMCCDTLGPALGCMHWHCVCWLLHCVCLSLCISISLSVSLCVCDLLCVSGTVCAGCCSAYVDRYVLFYILLFLHLTVSLALHEFYDDISYIFISIPVLRQLICVLLYLWLQRQWNENSRQPKSVCCVSMSHNTDTN